MASHIGTNSKSNLVDISYWHSSNRRRRLYLRSQPDHVSVQVYSDGIDKALKVYRAGLLRYTDLL